MRERSSEAKSPRALKKDQAWFERKVAELKTELGKLPADRQEQLRRELEEEKERRAMAVYKHGKI
ncbi:MAG: hypothetical protein ABSH49_03380 [Bryobacteraceae bacterium]|jgi:hypothetical protein